MLDRSARLVAPVPDLVKDAIEAANAHDVYAFAGCFERTGFLDARGMLFEGNSGVADPATLTFSMRDGLIHALRIT